MIDMVCVGIAGIDNDAPSLGMILSSAVNTNGRSSALTAPHGPSQQGLLRAALHLAGLQPSHVAALQMHSNGTPLGDPIEVGAAAEVLLQVGSCAILYTLNSEMIIIKMSLPMVACFLHCQGICGHCTVMQSCMQVTGHPELEGMMAMT